MKSEVRLCAYGGSLIERYAGVRSGVFERRDGTYGSTSSHFDFDQTRYQEFLERGDLTPLPGFDWTPFVPGGVLVAVPNEIVSAFAAAEGVSRVPLGDGFSCAYLPREEALRVLQACSYERWSRAVSLFQLGREEEARVETYRGFGSLTDRTGELAADLYAVLWALAGDSPGRKASLEIEMKASLEIETRHEAKKRGDRLYDTKRRLSIPIGSV